jgi:hypothetical protein
MWALGLSVDISLYSADALIFYPYDVGRWWWLGCLALELERRTYNPINVPIAATMIGRAMKNRSATISSLIAT